MMVKKTTKCHNTIISCQKSPQPRACGVFFAATSALAANAIEIFFGFGGFNGPRKALRTNDVGDCGSHQGYPVCLFIFFDLCSHLCQKLQLTGMKPPMGSDIDCSTCTSTLVYPKTYGKKPINTREIDVFNNTDDWNYIKLPSGSLTLHNHHL